MSWSRNKSLARIRNLQSSVPQATVAVRTFAQQEVLARRQAIKSAKQRDEDLIFNVQPNEAILVDGVHVYVQLVDYHNMMVDLEQGRETEASHSRLMATLHLHYSGCDRVAQEFEAQRVDYHGPRMHAVIVSPAGPENAAERVRRALAFAYALKRTIEAAGQRIGAGRFAMRVRIGIDAGPAVAVNSGRGSEQEPLFLGSPANHAAKLADGSEDGIFASDRVRRELGFLPLLNKGLHEERRHNLWAQTPAALQKAQLLLAGTSLPTSDQDIEKAIKGLLEAPELTYFGSAATFGFHHHEPPLRTIDFRELSPSKSIRMPLASIFADLDGFTSYVDRSISLGNIAEMVANLHVIRGELAACLKEDFSGRKIRFIGDCLHGLVAEGTRHNTDEAETARTAVRTAAGLRSSFELCQRHLVGVQELGLAIGVELGATPITRLGIRGDRSVRCAASATVSASEGLQSECRGNETALGPRALAAAPYSIKKLFGGNGKAAGLDFEAVEEHMAAPTIITSGSVSRVAQPHAK